MTRIGFLIFPDMLQLDFTGPFGVLAAGPKAEMRLIWKSRTPIRTSDNLAFTPDCSFQDCPQLDVIVVPGGNGILPLLDDDDVLGFLRVQAKTASWITSVCTGALVLGAAGLLDGYKATTHWLSQDLLELFGATHASTRVVADRNRITAAGVTSGIDMALTLAGFLWGDDAAQRIQLNLEYTPQPPYKSGSPESAPENIVEAIRNEATARQKERYNASISAANRLAQMNRLGAF